MGVVRNPYLEINRGIVLDAIMWEGAGPTVEDLSGNGNHGILVADTHFVPGKFGSALDFDGTGDYVAIDNAVVSAAPITVSVGFKVADASNNYSLVSISDASSNHRFSLEVRGGVAGNPVRWQVYGAGAANADTATGFSANTWHHACGVSVSSSDHRVYLDGGSKGTSSTNQTPANLDVTSIGARRLNNSSDFHIVAQIDHVTIWNRALNDSEIARICREPFCGFRWTNIVQLSSYIAAAGIPILRRRRECA